MPPTNVSASNYASRSAIDTPTSSYTPLRYIAAAVRYVLGFIFLWAFFDKLFGLGYSTKAANSMLNGGSATKGYLGNSKSWFSGFFHSIAGATVTDWLFMSALFLIGLALVLGIGMRVAGVSGALLMMLMYAAGSLGVPATTNPLVDDHIVYALLFVAMAVYPVVGATLGLGHWWTTRPIVQKYRILE